MADKDKHLGLRVDDETHKKLKQLADSEGRSMNGEVLYLIRKEFRLRKEDFEEIEP